MADIAVVCAGSATWDTIALVERAPAEDERIEAVDIRSAGGGPAATAAVALARLGVPVGFCGVVGTDAVGDRIIDGLAAAGVDVSGIVRDPLFASGQSVVTVVRSTQTRAIATRAAPPPPPAVLARAAEGAEWLHVDQAGWPAASRLTETRARLSLDAGNRIPGVDLGRLALYAPNRGALLARYPGHDLDGAIAAALADGAGMVAVTCGADGAVAADGREVARQPAFTGDIRSTLGAGDAFHGGMLAALVRGAGLDDALRLANAVAFLCCRALDGRSALPDEEELARFLHGIELSARAPAGAGADAHQGGSPCGA